MSEGNTKKIAINKCFGGFGLSRKAKAVLAERMGITLEWEKDSAFDSCYIAGTDEGFYPWDLYEDPMARENPDLVAVIEELGKDANGTCANLAVVEIPVNVEYYIEDYDGIESIHEKHRIWR